jgi:hypothetical protein
MLFLLATLPGLTFSAGHNVGQLLVSVYAVGL